MESLQVYLSRLVKKWMTYIREVNTMINQKAKTARIIKILLTHIILLMFVIIVLWPVIFSFVSSFKSSGEILAAKEFWPKEWKWDNYLRAWKGANFSGYTFNTVWYSVVMMVFSVFVNSLSGYVFARGVFPGKQLFFTIRTVMLFLSMGSATLYPQFRILNELGLSKTLWGLVLISVGTGSVTHIFMVRAFVLSLPKEMDEAAAIDGCSFMGTFFRITLPLIRPIIMALAVLSFRGAWNDYLFPMVVTFTQPEKRPLAVGLYSLQHTVAGMDWSIMLPGTIISAMPLIIIYIFLNKYFIESLTLGAVKG